MSSYSSRVLSSGGNIRSTSLGVVGHCVGSAIFAPIFAVVIAAAATIVAAIVIATVVAFLLGLIVLFVVPPIVVFGGALLRINIFRRYCFIACSELNFSLSVKPLRVHAGR